MNSKWRKNFFNCIWNSWLSIKCKLEDWFKSSVEIVARARKNRFWRNHTTTNPSHQSSNTVFKYTRASIHTNKCFAITRHLHVSKMLQKLWQSINIHRTAYRANTNIFHYRKLSTSNSTNNNKNGRNNSSWTRMLIIKRNSRVWSDETKPVHKTNNE